ncbi:type II CRISPR RNA-guided endonuclease Cas9 [Candidatus Saccharibacteria bacterium]|nr:type II CRISPR RNA-guided endonuclease Cas9 [Candidatus Saccharibacteria bacterium]
MKYSLGLDIGTTSVGWAVLNEDKKRIEDLGVRIFERPEHPKNGASLAKPRRDARSTRRRLRRRRQRLNSLKRFFIEKGLLSKEKITGLLAPKNQMNPYELRVKALNKIVSNEELFVGLYHIAKRRGYKSNRKKVEEEDKNTGKVLAAIKDNKQLLTDYKSVAEALLNNDKFKLHKRNKLDSYTNSFIREDFEKEMIAILKAQKWSDEWISELMYKAPNGLFFQRPFMTKELIEKMRGKCPLEKGEPRAQKASFSFEMFRLAQDLAHVTYNDGNKLTKEQIQLAVEKAKGTGKVTYKALKEAIGFKNDENFRFDYIRGKQEEYPEMEKHEFCNLKFYHAIKKACSEKDWLKVENDIQLFDEIGYILTVWKDDENVERELKKLELDDETINALMGLSFSGFAGHSLKAIRKLTPHMLSGMTYDKAVEAEYPGEFSEQISGDKNKLPPLTEEQQDQITNPVVKRAINQTRKVVNAVIGKYGSPAQIKIECTNELAKNFRDRMEIKRKQDENAENNEKIVGKLKELGITTPNGLQITKYKLREQQLCKCVYCGRTLGEEILINDGLADIDHVIPFSRCGNDSLNNKVVVCAECNREKTNLTPFEKWGHDADRWNRIIELTNASNMPSQKKKRVLAEKVPKEEWNARALNDTRYIMKFMAQYIKSNLKFSDEMKGKQKVLLPTGFITSYLRKMYHLGDKDRELNNCHHAVDACVIASVSQGQIKKFAEYAKWRELGAKYHTVIWVDDNGETHQKTVKEYEEMKYELLPWERFDEEVRKRSGITYDASKVEKLSDFRDKFKDFKTYDEEFISKIHPMFISRMPKRSTKGLAHEATFRSPKKKDDNRRLTSVRLEKIMEKGPEEALRILDKSILPESDMVLYEQLRDLVLKKGKDAFSEPVYKNKKTVDKNGKPISPVTSIKVYDTKPDSSGVYLNYDKNNEKYTQYADNGSAVCLNIYKRKNKLFAAPVYVRSFKSNKVEILPTPNGKSKDEKSDFNAVRDEDGRIFATKENGFEFVMSLYPNDYVRIYYEDHITEGYYVKYGIAVGTISLIEHNNPSKADLGMIRCSLGSAVNIKKLNISVLGDNYIEE